MFENEKNLFLKYDKPVPRYTSFPSYPYWKKKIDLEKWKESIYKIGENSTTNEFSIYMHFPFCESLCHFCGCNKIITQNHSLENEYLKLILKEWELYLEFFPKHFQLKELHIGGGTPTFMSPQSLGSFFERFFSMVTIAKDPHFSIEAHPGVTTKEHLNVLKRFYFSRLSLGVQDFDERVQKAVNRHQSFSDVEFCTNYAREIGFQSINFDLIYGLPFQSKETMTKTANIVTTLRPDRIAFYSYAHVPSTKPSQKKFEDLSRLQGQEKYELYLTGKKIFEKSGYFELGFDHFALPTDELYRAFKSKKLHRNFMGFTVQNTPLLIGLGVSSISDAGIAYAQNYKSLPQYQNAIENNLLDIQNGMALSPEDLAIKKCIMELACFRETKIDKNEISNENLKLIENNMKELLEDNLVTLVDFKIKVTENGLPFLRNICAALDFYFSKSISAKHSQSV